MHLDIAVLQAAVDQGQAPGSVVRRDDDQGVSVFLGPLQDLADDAVELEELLGHIADFVPVAPVVDLGTFNH